MRYVSTRGAAPALDFGDVLLTGLAADGGLYVPEWWPELNRDALDPTRAYCDVAIDVMWPFVEGSIPRGVFEALVSDAYSVFRSPDVTPLEPLADGLWVQELFWGPTLAFKDVALQLVGRLFDYELARRGRDMTVVAATSGDTGSAAIEACRDRDNITIVVLHPAGRVSEIQRRQMTTVDSPNVFNVAIDGSFDDCQDLVKAMFADVGFASRQRLGAVNSINWARIMAQIVYYVVGAARVGRGGPVSFTVPSGNFGNVFAGWCARRMGTPVRRLIVASNENDILRQFFETGSMRISDVVPTLSPAMDIQVSSNLERLLFELNGRNGRSLAESMSLFREQGEITFGPVISAGVSEVFAAGSIDDPATLRVIGLTRARRSYGVDPHTAVGLGVAATTAHPDGDDPMICLATAHPSKFPDAVEKATGIRPGLPEHLADLLARPERFEQLPNDLRTVEGYISDVTRRSSR